MRVPHALKLDFCVYILLPCGSRLWVAGLVGVWWVMCGVRVISRACWGWGGGCTIGWFSRIAPPGQVSRIVLLNNPNRTFPLSIFSVVCIWCTAELTVRGVHLWCTYDAPPSWQSVVLWCTAELTVRGVHMMHRRWCTAELTVRGVHMMHRRIPIRLKYLKGQQA